MPRPFPRVPLVSRVPLPVRRAALLLGVIAAVVGLPGTAQAAVHPASPAAPVTVAARALVTPASAATAGTPALVSRPAGPGSVTGLAGPAAPGGVCQVPGIGDIGGLLGFCAAGSSGLIGDINNVCQPSVPAPEAATGGIDALIRPPDSTIKQPATLYDSYGVAGQSWAAFDLQCSDMTSLIGNNVAGVVFDAAKALDRVTITVYQSAAGEGILSWLSGAVDGLITSLGHAIYFPYLAPVVIIGAIWLAWQGLIRKRASRTIEGTVWMVLACAAAIWLIGRPADFTGIGRTFSDGITQTLNIAFAKLPAPQQASCVPLQKGDPQTPAGANFAYTAGNGVVDTNANELWTVLVCKPWLDGEFGTTTYSAAGNPPTVVNKYGRQLLWAQAIAANEQPSAAVITAKQNAYAGIAASIKQNEPGVYPLFQGKQWTTRLEIGFAALFAALAAGLLVLLIAITLIILKLGFLLLLVAGPFFLIIGIHPGFGRVIALRWAEMLIGVLLKTAAIALVLSVLLYAYSLIMGASDAALPWALKILMIALVTVAVFIYRKPFGHLFSAVGYGVIGSRERAEASLAAAGSTARQNTVDAATVGVPGFAGYRAARWARRNPGQAASLAAGVAIAGTAGALAGAAAAGGAGADGSSGSAGSNGQTANGSASRGDGADPEDTQQAGSGSRGKAAGRSRVRGAENGSNGAGRTPPPLNLPPRDGESGPPPVSSWTRGGTDPAKPRWPGTAPRSAPSGAPPRPAASAGSAAPRAQAPGQPAPSAWGNGGPFTRSAGQAAARGAGSGGDRVPARDKSGGGSPRPASPGRSAPAPPPEPPGEKTPAGPFWLRPVRRRK
jgi:TrbL/VirB6 plasmid conjugal transfer protein